MGKKKHRRRPRHTTQNLGGEEKNGGSVNGKKKWFSKNSCAHWRQPVELLDGVVVTGSAWSDRPHKKWKDGDWEVEPDPVEPPDIGLYFYSSWIEDYIVTTPGIRGPKLTPTSHPWKTRAVYIPWKDWGLPVWATIFPLWAEWALDQAKAGKNVDFGCMGGHGRTGTALACLLTLQGMTPGRAVEKIRTEYCYHAVEGPNQVDYVKAVYVAKWGEDGIDDEDKKIYKEERAVPTYSSSTTYSGASGTPNRSMGTGKKKPEYDKGGRFEDKYPNETCIHDVWIDYVCDKCDTKAKVVELFDKSPQGTEKTDIVDLKGRCTCCQHTDTHQQVKALDGKTYGWCRTGKCKCRNFHRQKTSPGSSGVTSGVDKGAVVRCVHGRLLSEECHTGGCSRPSGSDPRSVKIVKPKPEHGQERAKCIHGRSMDEACLECDEEEVDAAKKAVRERAVSQKDPTDTGSTGATSEKRGTVPYHESCSHCGHPKKWHTYFGGQDVPKEDAWWCTGDPDELTFDCNCKENPYLRNVRQGKTR